MSKYISGHFAGTTGFNNWNTSRVWAHIEATQSVYDGTYLPKSFTINTLQGKMWTHGNATEHIYEAISSLKANLKIKNSNPKLYTQFILFDYWKSLGMAVNNGITYDRKIKSGNWEFIFSRPRKSEYYPVVKHAQFAGLK